MEFETPAQYDRDLRGPARDIKRHKDSRHKWRLGEQPLPGIPWAPIASEPITYTREELGGRVRPLHPPSSPNPFKQSRRNMVKFDRPNCHLASARVKSQTGIHEELEAGQVEVAAAAEGGQDVLASPLAVAAANDPFLYSFDKTVTPGGPLTLDAFVKAPTAKDTERLVEKEYEVVDENGRELKGREAKQNLRKGGSGLAGGKEVDDGFELV